MDWQNRKRERLSKFQEFADGICKLWRLPRTTEISDRELPLFMHTIKLPTNPEEMLALLPNAREDRWDSASGRIWMLLGGRAKLNDESLRPLFVRIARSIHIFLDKGLRPRQDVADFIEWDPRELNAVADHCANVALDMEGDWADSNEETLKYVLRQGANLKVSFDGARRGSGRASAGLAIYVYIPGRARTLVHRARRCLGILSSSFLAEAIALEWALDVVHNLRGYLRWDT